MKNISITLMRNYNFCSILFHKMSEKHLVKGLYHCFSVNYAVLNILLKDWQTSSPLSSRSLSGSFILFLPESLIL